MTDRHTLTIDLAQIGNPGAPGVFVAVEKSKAELVYPIVDAAEHHETLYPTRMQSRTNDAGVATFELLPSRLAGPYRVTVGSYRRTIWMPEEDASLWQLPEFDGEAVMDPHASLGFMRTDLSNADADLTPEEQAAFRRKVGAAATAGDDTVARAAAAAAQATADAALPKAGGTMTGDLVLHGAPTADLEAATKKYVDDGRFSGRYSDLTGAPAVPAKASNTDVDGETDDADYMTVAKTFRAIARKVKSASTTVRGTVQLARNADVDASETDTSRVPTVAAAIRLIGRLLSDSIIGGKAFRNPPTDLTPAQQLAVQNALGGPPLFERLFSGTVARHATGRQVGRVTILDSADVQYVISVAAGTDAHTVVAAGNELAGLDGSSSAERLELFHSTFQSRDIWGFTDGSNRLLVRSQSRDATVTVWLVRSVSAITPLLGRIPVALSRLARGSGSTGQLLGLGAGGWGPVDAPPSSDATARAAAARAQATADAALPAARLEGFADVEQPREQIPGDRLTQAHVRVVVPGERTAFARLTPAWRWAIENTRDDDSNPVLTQIDLAVESSSNPNFPSSTDFEAWFHSVFGPQTRVRLVTDTGGAGIDVDAATFNFVRHSSGDFWNVHLVLANPGLAVTAGTGLTTAQVPVEFSHLAPSMDNRDTRIIEVTGVEATAVGTGVRLDVPKSPVPPLPPAGSRTGKALEFEGDDLLWREASGGAHTTLELFGSARFAISNAAQVGTRSAADDPIVLPPTAPAGELWWVRFNTTEAGDQLVPFFLRELLQKQPSVSGRARTPANSLQVIKKFDDASAAAFELNLHRTADREILVSSTLVTEDPNPLEIYAPRGVGAVAGAVTTTYRPIAPAGNVYTLNDDETGVRVIVRVSGSGTGADTAPLHLSRDLLGTTARRFSIESYNPSNSNLGTDGKNITVTASRAGNAVTLTVNDLSGSAATALIVDGVKQVAATAVVGDAFAPTKENIYAAVKEIFHPATNQGVTADDGNSELDVPGISAGDQSSLRLLARKVEDIDRLREAALDQPLLLYGGVHGPQTALYLDDYRASNAGAERAQATPFTPPSGMAIEGLTAHGGTIYGLLEGDPADTHRLTDDAQYLLTLDPRTGAVTRIGSAVNYGASAFASDTTFRSFRPLSIAIDSQGRAYIGVASVNQGESATYTSVHQLNLSTGVAGAKLMQHRLDGSNAPAWHGLAFDADDRLYGVTRTALYRIDLAATPPTRTKLSGAQVTETAGVQMVGLAWSPYWHELVGWAQDGLVRRWNAAAQRFEKINGTARYYRLNDAAIGQADRFRPVFVPTGSIAADVVRRLGGAAGKIEEQLDAKIERAISATTVEGLVLWGGFYDHARLLRISDWRNSNAADRVALSDPFPIGDGASRGYEVTAIASYGEQAYGLWIGGAEIGPTDDATYLYQIDTTTGQGERVGSAVAFGVAALNDPTLAQTINPWALAIDGEGNAYMSILSENAAGDELYVGIFALDLATGAVTRKVSQAGATAASETYRGLTFGGDTLYASTRTELYSIDLGTGARTRLSTTERTVDGRTETAITETVGVKVNSIAWSAFWAVLVAWCDDGRFRWWDNDAAQFVKLNDSPPVAGVTLFSSRYFAIGFLKHDNVIARLVREFDHLNIRRPVRAEVIEMGNVGIGTSDEELVPKANGIRPSQGFSGAAEILSGIDGSDFTVAAGDYMVEVHFVGDAQAANSSIWFVLRRASDDFGLFTTSRVTFGSPEAGAQAGSNAVCTAHFAADTKINVEANRTAGHSISASAVSVKFTRL